MRVAYGLVLIWWRGDMLSTSGYDVMFSHNDPIAAMRKAQQPGFQPNVAQRQQLIIVYCATVLYTTTAVFQCLNYSASLGLFFIAYQNLTGRGC